MTDTSTPAPQDDPAVLLCAIPHKLGVACLRQKGHPSLHYSVFTNSADGPMVLAWAVDDSIDQSGAVYSLLPDDAKR